MKLLIRVRALVVILMASQTFCFNGTSQVLENLSLDEAIRKARTFYPLSRQKELITQTAKLNIDKLRSGYLPRLVMSGQATYQSAVTFVDIPVPGLKMERLSKDQYRIIADINQVIYDGGSIKYQQEMQGLNSALENQKVEIDLYELKQHITQVYLDILFLEEKLKALELVKKDISIGIKTVEAQVLNGVALRSSLNTLKAELLKAEQRSIELKGSRKGLLDALSLFLNQPLSERIILQMPGEVVVFNKPVKRPELQLFQYQKRLLHQQRKYISILNRPKTYAFVQGGYGRPGLNLLNNNFEPFYIGGIRLNWSLEGLYTSKKEKQLSDISERSILLQQELFMLNTDTKLKQQSAEIDMLKRMIAVDGEIVALRVSIKQAARAQLENSVLTSNDYLREVIAEDAARQDQSLHQLQLVQAQIKYANLKGE